GLRVGLRLAVVSLAGGAVATAAAAGIRVGGVGRRRRQLVHRGQGLVGQLLELLRLEPDRRVRRQLLDELATIHRRTSVCGSRRVAGGALAAGVLAGRTVQGAAAEHGVDRGPDAVGDASADARLLVPDRPILDLDRHPLAERHGPVLRDFVLDLVEPTAQPDDHGVLEHLDRPPPLVLALLAELPVPRPDRVLDGLDPLRQALALRVGPGRPAPVVDRTCAGLADQDRDVVRDDPPLDQHVRPAAVRTLPALGPAVVAARYLKDLAGLELLQDALAAHHPANRLLVKPEVSLQRAVLDPDAEHVSDVVAPVDHLAGPGRHDLAVQLRVPD